MTKLVKRTETAIDTRSVLRDRVIQRLQQAEQALMHALRIDQVKVVLDVAAAQKVFAQRQQLGDDVKAYAHELVCHAMERLGELLQDLEKATGTRGQGRPRKGGTRVVPPKTTATLSEVLNLPPRKAKKLASKAKRYRALPAETREAIAKGKKTVAAGRREQKAVEIRKKVTLPDAKFRVVYADPPWSYSDKAGEGAVQSGGAELHYPSMSIRDLCAMPIAGLCEDHAVLFLWVTSPLLFESAPVIKAWGFTYKASFIWDKVKHNMGHYNSVRHEFLLICTRGSCTPDVTRLHDSVQTIERTTHSTKPEKFRQIIESLYPHGKRLELFARKPADGWTAFGYEAASATPA